MNAKPGTQRRYDLDWLRVFAILAVFFYHSARFFDLGGWHIKNAVTYSWV
jgi:peptidoglycan/LPS O-acetylase OafA/YrhL